MQNGRIRDPPDRGRHRLPFLLSGAHNSVPTRSTSIAATVFFDHDRERPPRRRPYLLHALWQVKRQDSHLGRAQ
jgi:hypothetical protein